MLYCKTILLFFRCFSVTWMFGWFLGKNHRRRISTYFANSECSSWLLPLLPLSPVFIHWIETVSRPRSSLFSEYFSIKDETELCVRERLYFSYKSTHRTVSEFWGFSVEHLSELSDTRGFIRTLNPAMADGGRGPLLVRLWTPPLAPLKPFVMNPCREEHVAHLSFKRALCFRSFGVSVAHEDQLKVVTGSLAVPGCKSYTRTDSNGTINPLNPNRSPAMG